jgi:hypothetical protein
MSRLENEEDLRVLLEEDSRVLLEGSPRVPPEGGSRVLPEGKRFAAYFADVRTEDRTGMASPIYAGTASRIVAAFRKYESGEWGLSQILSPIPHPETIFKVKRSSTGTETLVMGRVGVRETPDTIFVIFMAPAADFTEGDRIGVHVNTGRSRGVGKHLDGRPLLGMDKTRVPCKDWTRIFTVVPKPTTGLKIEIKTSDRRATVQTISGVTLLDPGLAEIYRVVADSVPAFVSKRDPENDIDSVMVRSTVGGKTFLMKLVGGRADVSARLADNAEIVVALKHVVAEAEEKDAEAPPAYSTS